MAPKPPGSHTGRGGGLVDCRNGGYVLRGYVAVRLASTAGFGDAGLFRMLRGFISKWPAGLSLVGVVPRILPHLYPPISPK